jgi:peroxiredoxin
VPTASGSRRRDGPRRFRTLVDGHWIERNRPEEKAMGDPDGTTILPIRVGETGPPFRAPSSNGQTLDQHSFAGKVPVVLVFVGDPSTPSAQVALAELDDRLVDFGHERWQLLVVVTCPPRDARALSDEAQYALTLLADEGRIITDAYLGAGRAGAPTAVLLGPDGCILDMVDAEDVAGFATLLLECVRSL